MFSEKKVYITDNGFINVDSVSVSGDLGRKFEIAIYCDIRRKTKSISYLTDNQSEFDLFLQNKRNLFCITGLLRIAPL
jgi:predicted AAA+ superfamily ATPase